MVQGPSGNGDGQTRPDQGSRGHLPDLEKKKWWQEGGGKRGGIVSIVRSRGSSDEILLRHSEGGDQGRS